MNSRATLAVLCAATALSTALTAEARDVAVSSVAELQAAVTGAVAGDVISLADGDYDIDANLRCTASGTAVAPIVVRAVTPLAAHIRSTAVEGFVVSGAHWHFEGLDVEGRCADDSSCEHAWHIVGGAHSTVISGNRAHGFNAQIKGNGEGAPRVWPNDVLIEGNEFFNPAPRMTSNPVTPIDVVGGRRWIIRANYIHDHQKALGDGVSYAAFLKGNGRDGIIERNLVVCERLHTGGTRLGLSFGGGGSSPDSICEDGSCAPEHQGGIMRNNIIAHCPADVGIYVNECADCLVAHNTVFDTTGIDVRFLTSDTRVIGNLLSGRVNPRDSATVFVMGNHEMVTTTEWDAWFTDPGALDFTLVDGSQVIDFGSPLAEVTDDFCRNARDDAMPDIGAVEYDGDGPCDTTMPVVGAPMPEVDAGVVMPGVDGGPITPGVDGGGMGIDGGATPPAESDGCGCRAAGGGNTHGALALLALLVAAGVTRRSVQRRR